MTDIAGDAAQFSSLPPLPVLRTPTATFVAREETADQLLAAVGRGIRRHRNVHVLIWAIFGVALALWTLSDGVRGAIGVLLVFGTVAGTGRLISLRLRGSRRTGMRWAAEPGMTMELLVGSDAIVVRTVNGIRRISYDSMSALTVRPEAVVLCVNRIEFLAFPRELFTDELIDYIRTRMDSPEVATASDRFPLLPLFPELKNSTASWVAEFDTAARLAREWVRRWTGRRMTRLVCAVLVVLVVARMMSTGEVVAGAVAATLVLLVCWGVWRLFVRAFVSALTRWFHTFAAPGMPMSIRVGSDAVDIRVVNSLGRLRFDRITAITTTPDTVMLRLGGYDFLIFPRPLFPDEVIDHMRAGMAGRE